MPSNEKYQSAYGNSARHIYCIPYGRLVTSLGVVGARKSHDEKRPSKKRTSVRRRTTLSSPIVEGTPTMNIQATGIIVRGEGAGGGGVPPGLIHKREKIIAGHMAEAIPILIIEPMYSWLILRADYLRDLDKGGHAATVAARTHRPQSHPQIILSVKPENRSAEKDLQIAPTPWPKYRTY
ncbi:hypothetical protein DFH09DRAFT_1079563 [Mycena vulgaris]|nr:hypothetical protein DFH09DRAFT_1079563 [Mycena vulgaris]